MSLFESASLVVTPNGTKASKLYAIKPTDGSGDLVVTRETTATRVNSAGLIENVAVNVPRLDYSNGTCPSILVEPQRTNLLLNSETLATQSITVTAQSYTLSFYGSGTVSLSGTHIASVVGLGTARKTYTFTPTAGTLILTISGTCTKGQLEAGSYATSYIPTLASTVTRNADVISKIGISSLIGQTEGVMYFDLKSIADNDFKRLSINGGSYVNSIFFDFDNSNNLYLKVFNSGSAVVTLLASGVNIANRNKIAIAYKNNDFSFYVNGTQVASQSSGSVPSGLANYEFSLGGNEKFIGNINASALWKTRLSNTELATLTTI
jgi:hypothetical protein